MGRGGGEVNEKRRTWAVEQRLAWIKESVEIFGFLNREHIEKKFWVSAQQASADLKLVQERWPGLITYNASQKQYLKGAV